MRSYGEGSKGRRIGEGPSRGGTQEAQARFILGKGAMGNRPEAAHAKSPLGNWNQAHGGRFQPQQGGWARLERRSGQDNWKEGGRDCAIVLSEGNRPNPNQDIRCFRCLGTGRHQVDCTKGLVCYKCKEKGHMAVDCKASDARKIKVFGFGILGQGFYSYNFPESKIKTYQATGLLTILEGEASEDRIDQELKHLVREKWDFKVKQIHLQEYLVVFPDKGSLDTFTKLYEFQMSLFGLKGRIEKTERDFETSSMLHTVWIRVHGVLDLAREVDAMKEIVGLVAEPLVVDELSLIKDEPVRVQSRCRNPGAIRGAIENFFNGIGKLIRFEV